MKFDSKAKAMLSSYGRSFLAAAVALWTTGNTDPKALIAAGVIICFACHLKTYVELLKVCKYVMSHKHCF